MVHGPEEFIFELRLCNPNDYSKPFEVMLNDYELVVMNYSLSKINKLLLDESNKKLFAFSESEKTKLLKTIGALSMVISKSSEKYKNGIKPNVNQISISVLEMFDDIEVEHKDLLDKNGLGNSSLRDVISQGIKLLVTK